MIPDPEHIKASQETAAVELAAMTDEEFNKWLGGMRHGRGYIIPYPLSLLVQAEMERRDPTGTRLWG